MNFGNVYALPSLVSAVAFIVLTVYVLMNNPKRTANRVTALMFLGLIIWSTAELLERLAGPPPEQLLSMWDQWWAVNNSSPAWDWNDYGFAYVMTKLIGVGVLFVAPTVVHFALVVPKKRDVHWGVYALLYGSYFVMLPILLFTEKFIQPPLPYYAGWGTEYSDWLLLYLGYPLLFVIIAIVLLIRSYVKADTIIEKNQTKFVLIGMGFCFVLNTATSVIPPIIGWNVYPLTTVSLIILAGCMSYAIIKYKLFQIEAVIEEEVEEVLTLEKNLNYLIFEDSSEFGYRYFRGIVSTTPGLIFTSFHPKKLRKEYGLEKTPMIWLTETTTSEKGLSPSRLEFEILYTIESFMKENDETVVLIDDVKYLAMVNGFNKTVDFIKTICDIASMNDSTIIMPINPKRFSEMELHQLESGFDEVLKQESTGRKLEEIDLEPSYSYIFWEKDPNKSIDAVKRCQKRGLCITKDYPKKFQKRYDVPDVPHYWLSSTKKGDERTVDPKRIDFELTNAMAEHLRKGDAYVILHGLEAISLENPIEKVLDFLKTVIDIASEKNGIIVVVGNPGTFDERKKSIVNSRFDEVFHEGDDGENE